MGRERLVVLFEHASGYALFTVKEFEEVGLMIPEVEASLKDITTFKSIVSLLTFVPFKSGTNALDNCNSVSEGILHDDLKVLLETNVKSSKKDKVILGVSDSKLSASINEELGLSCQHTGVVPEIIRGIRVHFHKFIKGLTPVNATKAQLGLGHSYSRCKVKFNVNKSDNMIIQSINLLDQLDKGINTFSMRCREWYSYHFPELVKIVGDNQKFAKVVIVVGDRKQFTEERLGEVEEILGDTAQAQAVLAASKSSMGMDIAPLDLINIERFAKTVAGLADYRREVSEYLHSKMDSVAPNLATLIGDTVGARLISHAGSLTNLAKYPASTVQILGAEKALFRALKTRSNTPKYGLLYHSSFITRAVTKNKGRISRFLANKCSIASRIDCFSEFPTTVFGDAMKQQVEDRLVFYETGEIPKKNVEVMSVAVEEASVVQAQLAKKQRKKKKKEKKLAEAKAAEANANAAEENVVEEEVKEQTKTPGGKKKKKRKIEDAENEPTEEVEETPAQPPKKKKKKQKQ
ncbi:nucleolar protein 56-like isoform X2 [Watersipora subatra]|uniref:nucleolar protein 56-like isoform X2 n=1 Tax=Watersipora subatra TaxID=2589382 RepID=UPI00355C4B60